MIAQMWRKGCDQLSLWLKADVKRISATYNVPRLIARAARACAGWLPGTQRAERLSSGTGRLRTNTWPHRCRARPERWTCSVVTRHPDDAVETLTALLPPFYCRTVAGKVPPPVTFR